MLYVSTIHLLCFCAHTTTHTHSTLGALAEKCHAFAKALHYKELEYYTNPAGTIEALISINNQLRQPDAAQGVLELAERKHKLHVSVCGVVGGCLCVGVGVGVFCWEKG